MKHIHSEADVDTALQRLFELGGILSEATDRTLAAEGLTITRAEVMWRIGREGPLTQRELSQALRCTPRNVTGLVDALEDLGLVTRRPHPTDRRATLVTLTEQGTNAVRQWTNGHHQLGRHLMGDMSAAELAGFVATLDRIVERLRTFDLTTPD